MSMDDKNSYMRSSDRESKHNISIESNAEMDEEQNRKNSQEKVPYENEDEQDGYQEECEDNEDEEEDFEEEKKIDKNNNNKK